MRAFAHRTHLEPEAAQQAADAALDVPQLGHQQLACRQQGPHLLHHGRLGRDRAEPTHAHQLRHPTRIIPLGLHGHRLQRRLDVARLDQDRRQPGLDQPGVPPLRQGPRLQPDVRANVKPLAAKTATRASRSLRTLASRTICPAASTTHTLLHSNHTSIAASCSMAGPPARCFGAEPRPRPTITVTDSRLSQKTLAATRPAYRI
jgi:hypothetical protein